MTFQERIDAEIAADVADRARRGGKQTPRSPGEHTIEDFMRAVFAVDREEEAQLFYEGYVAYLRDHAHAGQPTDIARANIGWCFGEGMTPDRIAMWSRACGAAHPIFGVAMPTADEAFAAGERIGNALPAKEK